MEINISELSRFMQCPGWTQFEIEKEPLSEVQKEGIEAGKVLSGLLSDDADKFDTTGLDNEMVFDAREAVTRIKGLGAEYPWDDFFVEKVCTWKTGDFTFKGRADVTWIKDNELHVLDYKYGHSIVEVEENWQLIGYAVGLKLNLENAFSTVKSIHLHVFQPNAYHHDGPWRTQVMSSDELVKRVNMIKEKIKQTVILQSGKECRYCPAAATQCNVFNKVFYNSVDEAGRKLKENMTVDDLSKQLSLVEDIKSYITIKEKALKKIVETQLKEGHKVHGWRYDMKKGNRKWKDGVSPDHIETLTGIRPTEEVFLSPAKCEKKGIDKDLVKSFVYNPMTKALVRVNEQQQLKQANEALLGGN